MSLLTSAMNLVNNALGKNQAHSPSMRGKMSPSASPVLSASSERAPLAPPLPTQEDLHGHFLIPQAPPLPTAEMMHKHYLSRDRTLENASNILHNLFSRVAGVATDLQTTLPVAVGLTKEVDENGIPVPPALPTAEMLHKHYLIPQAPALPTAEDFHGHYLIPQAPALPTAEMMHKHYLSRDRTVENVQNTVLSYVHKATEVATDLKDSVLSSNVLAADTTVPIAPPLPTREDLHKHYLSRRMSDRAISEDLTDNEKLTLQKTYEPEQPAVASPWSFSKLRRMANNTASSLIKTFSATAEPMSSQDGIPIPPPLPTAEDMHLHYLIPLAPALPTAEMMHKHYLSRDHTLENAGHLLSNALHFVQEVATEVKDYVMETNIADMPSDLREVINAKPLDDNGIPVPPALPTAEMMHKHYLIPLAPALPTAEMMHKHYLSRSRTLENASESLRSAVNYVSEVASDASTAVASSAANAKELVVESVLATKDMATDAANNAAESLSALPAAAQDASANAADRLRDAADAAQSSLSNAVEAVKEAVLPAAAPRSPVGLRYPRSEVISESPILKKNVAGSRKISARKNYEGFKPLMQSNRSLRI